MNFDLFTTVLKSRVSKLLRKRNSVEIVENTKNNGIPLTELVINGDDDKAAFRISLNNCYEQYKTGTEPMDIAAEIVELFRSKREKLNQDMDFLMLWENAQPRVFYKLVNKEMNSGMLQEVPSVDYLDMTIIFSLWVGDMYGGNSNFIVTNSHCQQWDVTANELMHAAKVNTPELFPANHERVKDFLNALMQGSTLGKTMRFVDDLGMIILNNIPGYYGATAILYESVLSQIAEEYDSDIFILPSNVHAWFLLAAKEQTDSNKLREIAADVYEKMDDKSEFLSGQLYYYSREENSLSVVHGS